MKLTKIKTIFETTKPVAKEIGKAAGIAAAKATITILSKKINTKL